MKDMTSREWAQLGHDMALLQNAWEDAEYGGTGTALAELAESYDSIKYVLALDADTLRRRAESYSGLDAEFFGTVQSVDWDGLLEDYR